MQHFTCVRHCAGAPRARPGRQHGKECILLPLLGGISEEEEVALGDIDIEASPFKDPAEFHGFLLNNGAPQYAWHACT